MHRDTDIRYAPVIVRSLFIPQTVRQIGVCVPRDVIATSNCVSLCRRQLRDWRKRRAISHTVIDEPRISSQECIGIRKTKVDYSRSHHWVNYLFFILCDWCVMCHRRRMVFFMWIYDKCFAIFASFQFHNFKFIIIAHYPRLSATHSLAEPSQQSHCAQ